MNAGKATLGAFCPPLGLHQPPLPWELLLVQLRDHCAVRGEHRQCLKRHRDAIKLCKRSN